MSSRMLSQELVDLIIDDVYCIHGRQALLPLLQAARCFSRCRKYIYEEVTIPVKVESGILDQSLKKHNLRLLQIIQHKDVARLVKRVTYDLCFDSDEVVCMVKTSAWDTLIRLKHLLVNVKHITVDFGTYEYLHGIYSSSAIHFDAPLAEAITDILPISAFSKLEISSLTLHPLPLVHMLSKFPHISTLDLDNIAFDPDDMRVWADPRLTRCSPSGIEELCLCDTDLLETEEIMGLKNFFSDVKRLILLAAPPLDYYTDFSGSFLAGFLSTIKQLDELYIQLLSHDLNLPDMLRASSLWLELGEPDHLACVAKSLMAKLHFPFTIRLRRLAVIGEYDWDATEWRVLARALCHPRLLMVEVVIVLDVACRDVDEQKVDETRRYFDECRANVTVDCLSVETEWYLYRHALFQTCL